MTRHMTVPDDTASLEPSPPDAITRDRKILKVGAPSSTWRLLVVDDADNDYLVVRELLAQGLPGATINRAIAVSDACLTAAAADCVLLDVGVPDADGTVGVKRLTEEAPDTAIVVLTAAANEDLGVASLSAGAQDYLVKSRLDEQLLARSVRYAIERHRAAQLSRELIRADRQRAENARLERALTPTPIIRSSDITVVVRYQAGRRGSRLGGDFYDAVEGDDGRCAVLVGDVAGHGPDAAALAARLRSAWRALTLARLDQVVIVGVLDRFLRTEVEELTFATLSVLVVGQDRSDGTLVLAGHPPPVRLGSPSRTVGAGAHGPLVGVMPQPHWSSVEVGLGPGAELLLYTDGLVEGRAEVADEPQPALRLQGLVGDVAVGGVQEAVRVRLHQLVEDGRDVGVGDVADAVVAGVEIGEEARPDRHLLAGRDAHARAQREHPGDVGRHRAGVGCAQRDQAVDLGGAAVVLHVGPRHEPALGMADQVDLGGAGLGPHAVGEAVECLGRAVDVLRPERGQLEVPHLVAVGPQTGHERLVGEARPEQAVHDDHRIPHRCGPGGCAATGGQDRQGRGPGQRGRDRSKQPPHQSPSCDVCRSTHP